MTRQIPFPNGRWDRRRFVLTAAAFCPWARLSGQDAQFSTDVKVVNLLATVRSKIGEIVLGLTKDDFSLA
jgi:hypothetical protein